MKKDYAVIQHLKKKSNTEENIRLLKWKVVQLNRLRNLIQLPEEFAQKMEELKKLVQQQK